MAAETPVTMEAQRACAKSATLHAPSLAKFHRPHSQASCVRQEEVLESVDDLIRNRDGYIACCSCEELPVLRRDTMLTVLLDSPKKKVVLHNITSQVVNILMHSLD